MRISSLISVSKFGLTGCLLLLTFGLIGGMTGCSTPNYKQQMQPPGPEVNTHTALPRLVVGDTVTVTFSGIEPLLAQEEKPIKDDGTISLPDIGSIQAAGKTPGELEDLIHSRYVPAIYKHLNVTVKTTSDRVYFVRGEVKAPGRLVYVGPITVTKAITSAGDFTEFANRRNVILTRSNGQHFKLNCNKILDNEAPDPPVFPGDQIQVNRRFY